MSRNILSNVIKKQEFDYSNYKRVLGIFGFYAAVHSIYSLNTENETTIRVTEKYIPPRNISAKYIIHGKDEKNTPAVFEISTNMWWFQWNVDEIYSQIEPGKKYKIKYYGFRIPVLDMFPGIVGIKEIPQPTDLTAISSKLY